MMILINRYVSHYINNLQRYHAYFWEGSEVPKTYWSTWSSLWFAELEKKAPGLVEKEKVVELREGQHFASLFNNTIVVRNGKRQGT